MTSPIEISRDFKRNDGLKLPKITLKTFSSDPLDWKSFKETFEVAVHSKESITNIEEIYEEISARENFEYLKQDDSDKKKLNNHFTTSSLHAQIKVKKCVFCKNEDHYSDQWKTVTDIKSRREILSKGKYYFSCLKPGHIKKNCKQI